MKSIRKLLLGLVVLLFLPTGLAANYESVCADGYDPSTICFEKTPPGGSFILDMKYSCVPGTQIPPGFQMVCDGSPHDLKVDLSGGRGGAVTNYPVPGITLYSYATGSLTLPLQGTPPAIYIANPSAGKILKCTVTSTNCPADSPCAACNDSNK